MFEEDDDLSEAQFKSELDRFEQMIEQNDSLYFDSEMLEQIVDHYMIKNQVKKALSAIDHAKIQHPAKLVFDLRKAQIFSSTGKLKESLLLLQGIEKLEPVNVEILVTKASVFSQLRDHPKAIKYLEKALVLAKEFGDNDEAEEIRFDLALEYENILDFHTAIRVLKDIMANSPENESAIYEIAYCYERISEFDECIDYYNRYIDNNPYSFTAWYNLGNIYFLKQNIEKALWAYDYSIVINDEFSSAHFNMANTYMQSGEYLKARASYLRCIEIDGEDGLTMSYVGETYERLEDYDEAFKWYTKSKEISPELAEPWLGIGIILELNGDIAQALNYLRQAVSLQPENAHFREVLGQALFNAGFLVEAETELERAIQIDPLYSDAAVLLAKIKSGFSIEEGIEFLSSYEQLDKLESDARILLSTLYWNNGKFSLAIEVFQKEITASKDAYGKLIQLFPEADLIPEYNQFKPE